MRVAGARLRSETKERRGIQFFAYSLARIFRNPIARLVSVQQNQIGGTMLYWALVFFVVALIAGVLGFTGMAIAAAGIAKVLFVVFLLLFLISLVTHLAAGGRRSLN
jgi:uncharacterized membrane protein YtjA (UPF0391 family)